MTTTLTSLLQSFQDQRDQLDMQGFAILADEGGVLIEANADDEYVEFTVSNGEKTARTVDLDIAFVVFDYMRTNS